MGAAEGRDSILIVDDTPTHLEVLVDGFMDEDCEVFAATAGEAALEQPGSIDPDLVLLDVMLPVIFMTAWTDTSDKLKGFQAGAGDSTTKPFHYEEVSARVATHRPQARAHQGLEVCQTQPDVRSHGGFPCGSCIQSAMSNSRSRSTTSSCCRDSSTAARAARSS